MAEREAMIAAVHTHLRATTEGNRDEWLAIWAENAAVEDPVGYGRIEGFDAIRDVFWPRSRNAAPRLTLLEDVIVCGNEAIAIMSAEVGPEGQRRLLKPVVDHFVFDEAGKVAGMRAFFAF